MLPAIVTHLVFHNYAFNYQYCGKSNYRGIDFDLVNLSQSYLKHMHPNTMEIGILAQMLIAHEHVCALNGECNSRLPIFAAK